MRLPAQVSVYVARPAGGGWEYLLLHRVPDRGGFWQGVTGAPEPGEALADAARRELLEETGLTPKTFEQVDYTYSFPVREEWREIYGPDVDEVVEYVFLAQDTGGDPVLSREHDDWRWCPLDEAPDLLVWPENKEALRRCEAVLRSHPR